MDDRTAIGQMYFGGRGNFESVKLSRESREKAGEVDEKYKKLQESLSSQAEIWQLFEDFENAVSGLRAEEAADHYAEGFKFGLLMGVGAGESK